MFSLSEALHGKGWYNLTKLAPGSHRPVDYESTIGVFKLLKQKIEALSEDQRSTTTVHIRLCLEAIVFENMNIPTSEESMDAFSDMETCLH